MKITLGDRRRRKIPPKEWEQKSISERTLPSFQEIKGKKGRTWFQIWEILKITLQKSVVLVFRFSFSIPTIWQKKGGGD